MTYTEAFSLFLSELRSQAQQQGMVLHVDAISFASDLFSRTVQSKGIPNKATIKETAKRWVEHLQTGRL